MNENAEIKETTQQTGQKNNDFPTKDEASGSSQGDEKKEEKTFECNICLDTARDAVVSMCGHLFCWPCLHQWLETKPYNQVCPVCKAGISREKVVPLYGRGSGNQQDPREKHPPRPSGQRSEPESGGNYSVQPNITSGLGGSDGLKSDFHPRFQFCEQIIRRRDNNVNFIENIIVFDDATFILNGSVNRQNCRCWATENPRWTQETHVGGNCWY